MQSLVGSLTLPTVWIPHLRSKPDSSRPDLQGDLRQWLSLWAPKLHPYDRRSVRRPHFGLLYWRFSWQCWGECGHG